MENKEASMSTLQSQRVWITGASSGIGAATAKRLAQQGCHLILSARRQDRLESLRQEIERAGGSAEIVPLDVADKAAVFAAGEKLEREGGVDILINNAGIMPLSPLAKGRVDDWERTIDINIKGLLYTTHAVLSGMIQRKKGHIVNLGSVASRVAFPAGAVYCGSKFAVAAISEALRKEVVPHGIRVTVIEPGAVGTELAHSITDEETRQMVTGPQGFYAPGLEILSSDDIAEAILYCVSQPPRVNVCELLVRPQIQEL